MKKNLRNILIIISILVVIAIILALCIYILNIILSKQNKSNNEIENSNINNNILQEEEIEKARDDFLASKTETTRMKTYIGRFFSLLESKDYQKAYDMLFDNFKSNYFPTLEKFMEYAINKYPKNIVLEYEEVKREGDVYILSLKIIDGFNTSNSFEQRVVIDENGLNDFKISFQVN